MPYKTLSGGLPLQVPTPGTRDYASNLEANLFQKIVDHDHTAGKGSNIGTSAIANDAVTGAKIQFNNNEYLEAMNAGGTSALGLLKLSTSNLLDFNKSILASVDWSGSAAFSTLDDLSATGTFNLYRYMLLGQLVVCVVRFTCTTVDPSVDNQQGLGFTLPFAAASLGYDQECGIGAMSDAGSTHGSFRVRDDSSVVAAFKADFGSWTEGAGKVVRGTFAYLRA